MKQRIMIDIADNGAVLRDNNKEFPSIVTFVFDEDNLEDFRALLYELVDRFNLNSSRHNEKRIEVNIVHGDKFECSKGKNCEICGGGK